MSLSYIYFLFLLTFVQLLPPIDAFFGNRGQKLFQNFKQSGSPFRNVVQKFLNPQRFPHTPSWHITKEQRPIQIVPHRSPTPAYVPTPAPEEVDVNPLPPNEIPPSDTGNKYIPEPSNMVNSKDTEPFDNDGVQLEDTVTPRVKEVVIANPPVETNVTGNFSETADNKEPLSGASDDTKDANGTTTDTQDLDATSNNNRQHRLSSDGTEVLDGTAETTADLNGKIDNNATIIFTSDDTTHQGN